MAQKFSSGGDLLSECNLIEHQLEVIDEDCIHQSVDLELGDGFTSMACSSLRFFVITDPLHDTIDLSRST
jgi:hypothetical protein